MASANYVQVKMRDRLAAIAAGVRNHAKAIGTKLLPNFAGLAKQVAEHRLVRSVDVAKRLDRLLWDHQYMHWRYGRDVVKGEAKIVLVHLVARQLAPHHAGKDRGLLCGFAHRVLL